MTYKHRLYGVTSVVEGETWCKMLHTFSIQTDNLLEQLVHLTSWSRSMHAYYRVCVMCACNSDLPLSSEIPAWSLLAGLEVTSWLPPLPQPAPLHTQSHTTHSEST